MGGHDEEDRSDFFAGRSVSELWTKSDYWLEDQGRLTEPLRYNPDTDHFEIVGWDEAFAAIGEGLNRLDHPDQGWSRDLREDEATGDDMVLRLTTLRSHDQFNATVYALNDRYRGVFGRRDIVFLNENEMTRRGLEEGDLVELVTALQFARDDRIVRGLTLVRFDLPNGCCASYYPETQPLIALENHDPHSMTPSYKSVPVHIRRTDGGRDEDRIVVSEGVAGRPLAGR